MSTWLSHSWPSGSFSDYSPRHDVYPPPPSNKKLMLSQLEDMFPQQGLVPFGMEGMNLTLLLTRAIQRISLRSSC